MALINRAAYVDLVHPVRSTSQSHRNRQPSAPLLTHVRRGDVVMVHFAPLRRGRGDRGGGAW